MYELFYISYTDSIQLKWDFIVDTVLQPIFYLITYCIYFIYNIKYHIYFSVFLHTHLFLFNGCVIDHEHSIEYQLGAKHDGPACPPPVGFGPYLSTSVL